MGHLDLWADDPARAPARQPPPGTSSTAAGSRAPPAAASCGRARASTSSLRSRGGRGCSPGGSTCAACAAGSAGAPSATGRGWAPPRKGAALMGGWNSCPPLPFPPASFAMVVRRVSIGFLSVSIFVFFSGHFVHVWLLLASFIHLGHFSTSATFGWFFFGGFWGQKCSEKWPNGQKWPEMGKSSQKWRKPNMGQKPKRPH